MKNANGVLVYENVREMVEPQHSCLVVWDVQNGLVDRIFNKDDIGHVFAFPAEPM
jgi:hypothetical protein